MEKMNTGREETLNEMLEPFLELFSQQSQPEKMKERSYSHRELEIKRSLDRGSKFEKDRKKKSNEILIKDEDISSG